jgi:hypothetical protein
MNHYVVKERAASTLIRALLRCASALGDKGAAVKEEGSPTR